MGGWSTTGSTTPTPLGCFARSFGVRRPSRGTNGRPHAASKAPRQPLRPFPTLVRNRSIASHPRRDLEGRGGATHEPSHNACPKLQAAVPVARLDRPSQSTWPAKRSYAKSSTRPHNGKRSSDTAPAWPNRGRNVQFACTTLTRHYPALLNCPSWTVVNHDRTITDMDGPGAIVWLMGLHRRANRNTGLIERAAMLPEKCPECARAHMRHVEGGNAVGDDRGTVWCPSCSLRWTWDEYMTYTERLIFGGTAA